MISIKRTCQQLPIRTVFTNVKSALVSLNDEKGLQLAYSEHYPHVVFLHQRLAFSMQCVYAQSSSRADLASPPQGQAMAENDLSCMQTFAT